MKRHFLGAAALVFLIISGLFLTAGCGQLNTPLTALFSDDGSAVDDASEGEDENSTIITDASEAEDGT